MLHLITGDKGSGKTQYTYDVLADVVSAKKEGMLIIPKHFTFDSDKGILHKLGPQKASEVQVLSFSRLADTVLKIYAGIHKPLLPQGAKSVYMALAIKNVKHELNVFKNQKNEIALVDMMLEIVDELKSDAVDIDELKQVANDISDTSLKEKLEGIVLVYEAYDALVQNSFFDTNKLMSKILDILLDKDFFDGQTIVIDGFYTFSKQELNLIALMMKKAENVYINLCSENIFDTNPLSPFNVSNETAKKLRHIANLDGIQVKAKHLDANLHQTQAELLKITKNLYNINAIKDETEISACSISSATSISLECDIVASKIRKNAAENKYRYRDMMVVFADVDTYDENIKQAFKKYEIPIFDDKRQPILNQPLITALSNLLAICANGFNTDYIFRYLKTGVTKFSSEEIFDLENYVFMWDIDGKAWTLDFKENSRGFGSSISEDSIKELDTINQTRQNLVAPIMQLRQDLEGKTGKQIAKLLYLYLVDNEFDESLKDYAVQLMNSNKKELAKEQEQVWDILMEILDELAISLSDCVVSAKLFADLFHLVVASKSLGNLPDGFDQVMVCDTNRAVIKKAKCVFLLGVNDGVLPKVSSNEGFLKDAEKAKINTFIEQKGFELSQKIQHQAHEQRFLVHSVFASASEQLHLSYSISGLKGEKLNKSNIITKVQELFPKVKMSYFSENDMIEFVSSEKSAFEAYSKLYGSNSAQFQALKAYFQSKPNYKGKLESIDRAFSASAYKFSEPKISKSLFGKNMSLSASRIEDYNKCQFMYFCKFGIGAKPRRKAKFDPMQSGTVVHWVLEKMLQHYKQKTFLEKPAEDLTSKIRLYLDEYVTLYMGGLANKDARFNYLYMRMQKTLEDIFLRLKIEFESSEFEPWKYELEISSKGEVKPFKVMLDDGYVQLGGIVDRVDKMDKDGKRYIRVVDYKTGSKEFELCEVLHGLNMQMLLYLMAIQKSDQPEYKASVPSGILYFPARSEVYAAKRNEKDENKLDVRLKSTCKMNGMILDDENVIDGMDTSGEYKLIPISVNAKTKKIKGNFINLRQLGILSQKMDEIIKQMGNGLHSGDIDAMPIKIGSGDKICTFCEYASVCLKEKGDTAKQIPKVSHEKTLQMLEPKEESSDE